MYFEIVDWADIKAQSEQFAMDPGRSPQRVFKAHSSNEVAHLLADPAVGPQGSETSIASRRQNPFDANARRSQV